jgi:hypothetical protein
MEDDEAGRLAAFRTRFGGDYESEGEAVPEAIASDGGKDAVSLTLDGWNWTQWTNNA